MRVLAPAIAAVITLLATPVVNAADPYKGVKLVRGTVFSVGRADPRGDNTGPDLDSGVYIDANYSSVFINGGIGGKDFAGSRVASAYAGIGLGRMLQLQVGYGDRGPVGRVRSDLNLRSVYSLVTQQTQPRREKTLADRITFSYSLERYNDEENEEFDNATIGIGVLYEWPKF
ncbi:MAG: hypothetical protein ACLGHJ_03940 [Gammaproteobacteria bacterium]